jgi:hypothetical protein
VHLQGVFFVNFIGSLRWIDVMKSAFQVVGYVGYVLLFSWVEYGSVLRDQSVIRSYHHDGWRQGGHR